MRLVPGMWELLYSPASLTSMQANWVLPANRSLSAAGERRSAITLSPPGVVHVLRGVRLSPQLLARRHDYTARVGRDANRGEAKYPASVRRRTPCVSVVRRRLKSETVRMSLS